MGDQSTSSSIFRKVEEKLTYDDVIIIRGMAQASRRS